MHKDLKGITLISMVITIVILLILAGVIVFLTIGNNGILKQSSNAVLASRAANEIEEIKFAWVGVQAEYLQELSKTPNIDKFKYFSVNNLNKYMQESSGKIIDISEENGVFILEYQLKDDAIIDTFTADENGNVYLGLLAGQITKANYGTLVNYEVSYNNNSNSKWKIFYADSNYVYLITKSKITGKELIINGYNGTEDFSDLTNFPAIEDGWLSNIYANGNVLYKNDSVNMKATEWLLDSGKIWNKLYKDDKAKWAIGAPTLELFVESFNKYTGKAEKILNTSQNGYECILSTEEDLPKKTYLNRGSSYWLACPSSENNNGIISVLARDSSLAISNYSNSTCSFRPIVCLKSNIGLVWNEKTKQFDLYSN